MSSKVLEWLRRYVPAEIGGTLGALAGALLVRALTPNLALIALAGTWGENAAYYLVVVAREIASVRSGGVVGGWRTALRVARNLGLEFGLAEALDSGVVRPALMYLALRFVPTVPAALVVGKLAADVVFYGIAITMYELRRRRMDADRPLR